MKPPEELQNMIGLGILETTINIREHNLDLFLTTYEDTDHHLHFQLPKNLLTLWLTYYKP